jgi:hypothetical protein
MKTCIDIIEDILSIWLILMLVYIYLHSSLESSDNFPIMCKLQVKYIKVELNFKSYVSFNYLNTCFSSFYILDAITILKVSKHFSLQNRSTIIYCVFRLKWNDRHCSQNTVFNIKIFNEIQIFFLWETHPLIA